jgi:hypothetical protein
MIRNSVTALLILGCLDFAVADEPLHTRIDQLIQQQADGIELAGRSDDAEFHRRVWLDLAGQIPTAAETRAFLSDASTGKRQRLIDERLESPEYARRMSELFHAVLMERRNVNEEWTRFLRTAFERNLPWDRMAQALIRADADDSDLRGAAFFLTARLVSEGAMAPVDIPGLTRDVGRLLAGVDLQCAQCHNHLTISDYEQKHFQGLHMIFENMQTRRDVKFPALSERLMTVKKEYLSVFDQIPMETGLVIPGGSNVDIVTFEKGEEYAVAPNRETRAPGIPKFSPLGELASGLATADNELFCRNIANRLWFVMMGRGLVEPLDLQHSDNPATHPELLDLLAHEFAAHDFNIRWFLRELALTETYQRTSQVKPDQTAPPVESYAVGLEKRLNAEQLFWSMLVATDELTYRASKPAEPPAPATTEETEAPAEEPEEPPREPLKLTDIEQVQAGSLELTELRELFLAAYANAAKEPEIEFNPSVKAALFLMHEEKVLALLEPRTGNLVDRLSGIDDPSTIADELFTAILGRPPSDEDRNTVTDFLKKHTDHRTDAISQLAWAMLASTEFCVNH